MTSQVEWGVGGLPRDGQMPPHNLKTAPRVPPPAPSMCLGGGRGSWLQWPTSLVPPGPGLPQVLNLPLLLLQYQVFPIPGGGPPGLLSSGSWGWSGRRQVSGDGEGDPPPLCTCPSRAETMAVPPPRTPSISCLCLPPPASCYRMNPCGVIELRNACIHPAAAVL